MSAPSSVGLHEKIAIAISRGPIGECEHDDPSARCALCYADLLLPIVADHYGKYDTDIREALESHLAVIRVLRDENEALRARVERDAEVKRALDEQIGVTSRYLALALEELDDDDHNEYTGALAERSVAHFQTELKHLIRISEGRLRDA